MAALFETLITQIAVLSLAVFFAVRAMQAFEPLQRARWFRRALPILPPALGALGALVGQVAPGEPWFEQLLLGVVAGGMSTNLHAFLRQTVLGDDHHLNERYLQESPDDHFQVLPGGDSRLPPGPRRPPRGESHGAERGGGEGPPQ